MRLASHSVNEFIRFGAEFMKVRSGVAHLPTELNDSPGHLNATALLIKKKKKRKIFLYVQFSSRSFLYFKF